MRRDMYNLLLADDDMDDCIFFKEALDELPFSSTLITVKNGEELMQQLETRQDNLPDMLFLDLNMPRKNGYECLGEIKTNKGLRHIPVIILSTSFDDDKVNSLYENGASYYIRKPGDFKKLKQVIEQAVSLVTANGPGQPPKEKYVLNSL